MSDRIRVLIVDDDVVTRRVLTRLLGRDPGLEVMTTAAAGGPALSRVREQPPDVVLLDYAMPGMDGLETIEALHALLPNLPVIVVSSAVAADPALTRRALAVGATDVVAKPSASENPVVWVDKVLTRAIRAVSGRITQVLAVPPPARPVDARRPAPHPGVRPLPGATPVDLILIAASTGGPAALGEILGALPADLPAPILLVQHMPPTFAPYLVDLLTARSRLRVAIARDNVRPAAGEVWIAPGNLHLEIDRDRLPRLRLSDLPPENSCRPAADVLFRTAAASDLRCLGIVLTGMGQDGLRGAATLVRAGGELWAQDRASSAVWGMPGAVVDAGLTERVLGLGQIAPALTHRLDPARVGKGRYAC